MSSLKSRKSRPFLCGEAGGLSVAGRVDAFSIFPSTSLLYPIGGGLSSALGITVLTWCVFTSWRGPAPPAGSFLSCVVMADGGASCSIGVQMERFLQVKVDAAGRMGVLFALGVVGGPGSPWNNYGQVGQQHHPTNRVRTVHGAGVLG